MKAIAALLLLALAACCHAGVLINSPLGLSPITYSLKPKVRTVEIERPVVTKANLKVLTDDDEISTTEIKPLAYAADWRGIGWNRGLFI